MNELTMYLNSGLAIMAFALIVIIVLLFMVYNLCQEREELKHSIESGVSSQPQNPRKPAMKNEDLKVSFGIGDEVQQLGQDRIPGIVTAVRQINDDLQYTVASVIDSVYQPRVWSRLELKLLRRANVESIAMAFSLMYSAMNFTARSGLFDSFAVGDVVKISLGDSTSFLVTSVGSKQGDLIYVLECGTYHKSRSFKHGDLKLVRRADSLNLSRALSLNMSNPGNNVFTPPATVHPTQRLSAYMVNFYYFVPGESPDTVRRVRHSQVMYGYDYDQILLQVNAFRVQVGLTEFRPEGLIVQHLTTL